uniref:Uncharacterized protein n=2 Tax=Gammaproteobacteria TaxID=1236 RepID=A0A1V0M6X4_PSEAI|nr:hypothetical protein [Klebsiella pneumoniae]ARD70601.1 Hypothetical protein [Pseudomonas aeruginosa]
MVEGKERMSAVASQRKAPQAKAHCGAYRVPSKLPKKSRQWALLPLIGNI